MSNKHTPGPWKLKKDRRTDCIEILGDGWGLANLSPLLRAGGVTENEANARLFAAAPDMLEALKDAECELSVQRTINSHVFDKVSAAINKAEGRGQ